MQGNRESYYSKFDPRIINGCALWLDAADFSTITLTSGAVSQWNDKSGYSNHASQSTAGNRPTYTAPTISFAAANTQYLQISNPSIRPTNAYVVVQANSITSNQVIYQKGYSITTSLETALRYNVGNIDVSYVNTTPAQAGTKYTGGATTSRTLVEATFDQANIVLYANGTQQGTVALTGAQRTAASGATDMRIGADFSADTNGNTPTASSAWNGTMCEIIMYSNALSNWEREAVEGYLAQKWGLQSSLISNHAYRTIAPFMRLRDPLDTYGCEYWFDSGDVLVNVATGTTYTSTSNKGWAQGNVSNSVTAGTPSYGVASNKQNGLNTITLKTTDNIAHTGGNPYQVRTRFFAMRPKVTTVTGVIYMLYLNAANNSGNDCIAYVNNTLAELAQGITFTMQTDATIQERNGKFEIYTFMNAAAASNNRIAINGGPRALPTSLNAGSYNTGSGPYYFNRSESTTTGTFDLGEFLSYHRELPLSQVQQIEAYLTWKWGVWSDLCVNHPYYNRPGGLFSIAHTPQLPGCQLWLDALDSSSFVLSGSNVVAWLDKSGNKRHIQQNTAGNRPTLTTTSNDAYVSFVAASSQYIDLCDAATMVVNKPFSFFCVEQRTSTTSANNYFLGGTTLATNSNLVIGYTNNTTAIVAWYNNDFSSTVPGYASDSNVRIWSYLFTGSSKYWFLNGILVAADNTGTQNLLGWAGASLGKFSTSTFFQGRVREIQFYNPCLTEGQRQQVEGYLARKWGVMTLLSNSHPYKYLSP